MAPPRDVKRGCFGVALALASAPSFAGVPESVIARFTQAQVDIALLGGAVLVAFVTFRLMAVVRLLLERV